NPRTLGFWDFGMAWDGGFQPSGPPSQHNDHGGPSCTHSWRNGTGSHEPTRIPKPWAPCLATCRRSESDHDRSPGDEKWGSGIETTIRAKDGSAERLVLLREILRTARRYCSYDHYEQDLHTRTDPGSPRPPRGLCRALP